MDYFNELLYSYNRLKKRTFKLRYIQEETAEELKKRGFQFNPGSAGAGGKYRGFYYSSDGSIIYVSEDPPGTENRQFFQLPEKERGETAREKRTVPGEKLYEEIPEEYRENIISINGISEALSKFCDQITQKFQQTKKYVSCEQQIQNYLNFTNKSGDSLGKIFSKSGTTKGIEITRDKEGNIDVKISEGMDTVDSVTRQKILDNLNSVLKEVTSKSPNCDNIKNKVAKTKHTEGKGKAKDRYIIYGADNTTGIALPATGRMSALIFDSIKKVCPDQIEKLYDDAINQAQINAKSGTLAERLFALGNDIYQLSKTGDREKSKKLVTQIAQALLESEKITQSLVDAFDTDMITLEEESGYQTLLEDNELFKNKPELSKLLILFVKANQDLYRKMGADKIVPYGAKSKQGARADNMLVYTSEDAAKKAARSVGFSEEEGSAYEKTNMKDFLKNLPENVKSKVQEELKELGLDESSEFYTLGLGQKLYIKFKDAKLGEYNRAERMFMAVLGTIPESDPYYSDDFNEKSNEYPISDESIAFFESLENDHQLIENVLLGGEEFLNSEGAKSLTPERYKFAQEILKAGSNPQGNLANLDPTNKADQQYIKEYIQRKNIVDNLRNRFEDPQTSSDTFDSVLRMAFLTGGNSKDLMQLVVSKADNSTRVFSQNAIFEELRDNKDKYTLDFTESGVKFIDKESGQLVGRFNLSRTASKSAKEPSARTRFDFEISDWAQTNIAKAEERNIPSMENSSKISELLANQIELLTELFNQTKKN